MKHRLVVMLSTRDEELREGQRRIEAMIDWLVQMYLAHTPEVPEERRPAAAGAPAEPAGPRRERAGPHREIADAGPAHLLAPA